ncbi:O-antigen ligase family protein [Myroides odoratimimus]|uniref:O-antigen ligase-related domain-containing protein n=2 Tax=Myroides odoratimimus TaxID=76832 RepID=A0A0S7E715_9FLAO|nr:MULTISPECIES: O-antigen ligase family protein [Myroides]AJA68274.1 Lipid A core - O-antigen ligase [Myroides sp. A21]ALU25572.1 hypothetical protein AS202_05210 [Myroides odoratimimus]EHO10878.1 hypothetical protein HMPREF9712_01226 [Myroides odoratimimus CCUG 10230]EHO15298.1 hypothetical protein HMPREF9714_00055 [Myroides odoratimimus CCUG 12901]MCA4791259.1 O-antigen ligase family protein [Myroides odoratimimus]
MERKLVLLGTSLFCFLIPIYTKLANIGLGLLVVSVLFYIYKNRKNLEIYGLKIYVKNSFKTTVFIFVLLILGLLYTEDLKNSIKLIERFSSYLLIPIIFSFFPLVFLQKIKDVSFKAFVGGTFVSSCILILNNFYNYYLFKGQSIVLERDIFSYDFTYHVFASLLDFHPVFYGFYVVFALVIVLENKTVFHKTVRVLLVFVLVICLLFLNSRSPFLLLTLYILFCIIRAFVLFVKYRKGGIQLLIVVSLVIFSSLGLNQVLKGTYLYERISSQVVWELTENKGTSYSGEFKNDSRWSRWEAIFYKGMEHPFVGSGSGSEDRISLEAYKQEGLIYAVKEKYGPHNQYLSFFIEYGLVGVALFFYFLVVNVIHNIRAKNFTFLFLFVIIGVGSLFDSILYRNMAIIFFSFYASIFTLINLKNERRNF